MAGKYSYPLNVVQYSNCQIFVSTSDYDFVFSLDCYTGLNNIKYQAILTAHEGM
jgi:hypothetical protein